MVNQFGVLISLPHKEDRAKDDGNHVPTTQTEHVATLSCEDTELRRNGRRHQDHGNHQGVWDVQMMRPFLPRAISKAICPRGEVHRKQTGEEH